MAKHLIFLVHGMGTHKKGWSDQTQALIKKLYAQFPSFDNLPFDETYEFKEIRYDNLFQDIRRRWKDNSSAVLKILKDNNMKKAEVAKVAKLGAAGSQDNFFTTHILDVIFYRFVPLVTDHVRVNVAKQILGVLKNIPDHSTIRWSVIAHSLGTAVIHDTIHALYNTPIPNMPGSTLSTANTRAKVIMMVANVSRLLQTSPKAYDSLVRPSLEPSLGACAHYINVRHQLDPFTKPKQFDPADDWPEIPTRNAGRYQEVVTSAIMEPNVHDLNHYLSNPKVHVPLFRTLTAPFFISEEEAQANFNAYLAKTPTGQFKQLRQKLKKLLPGENAGWGEISGSFTQFLKSV